MHRSIYRVLTLAAASLIAIGCSEDPVATGGNDNEIKLPANPCGVAADAAVGANGFRLTGIVYRNQLITFNNTPLVLRTQIDATTITYMASAEVTLDSGKVALITATLNIPGRGAAGYAWNSTATGTNASGLRVEIVEGGALKYVFKQNDGNTKLDSTITNTRIQGTFCGTMKDSLSGKLVAVTSGAFSLANDPGIPADPCSIPADAGVGKNGFHLRGSTFIDKVVMFSPGGTYDFEIDFTNNAINYGMQDLVQLGGDAPSNVRTELTIPGFNSGTYNWGEPGTGLASVRLVVTDGASMRVFRSMAGSGATKLDTLIEGAVARGTFCGTLKDSLSDTKVAITGGKYSSD